jgi:hypothetical protein
MLKDESITIAIWRPVSESRNDAAADDRAIKSSSSIQNCRGGMKRFLPGVARGRFFKRKSDETTRAVELPFFRYA